MFWMLGAAEHMPFVDGGKERKFAAIPKDRGRVEVPVPRRIAKHSSGGGCDRRDGGYQGVRKDESGRGQG
jgi:hypothetical protein